MSASRTWPGGTRDRHPPRLLGFCVGLYSPYKFVPLPQPPELAALSHRAASSCNDAFAVHRSHCIKYCRNGHLLIERLQHRQEAPPQEVIGDPPLALRVARYCRG